MQTQPCRRKQAIARYLQYRVLSTVLPVAAHKLLARDMPTTPPQLPLRLAAASAGLVWPAPHAAFCHPSCYSAVPSNQIQTPWQGLWLGSAVQQHAGSGVCSNTAPNGNASGGPFLETPTAPLHSSCSQESKTGLGSDRLYLSKKLHWKMCGGGSSASRCQRGRSASLCPPAPESSCCC